MGKNRFVTPETVRLELTDGDWIDVKTRLAYGEQYHLRSMMYGRVSEAEAADPGIDIEAAAIEYLATWIVDWSFRGADDKPVALSRDAIRALDTETADEVQGALAAHVQAISLGKATPNGRPRRAARST